MDIQIKKNMKNLSDIYEDNLTLMRALKREIRERKKEEALQPASSLEQFFSNIHTTLDESSELFSKELSILEKQKQVNNLQSQNNKIKRYK